MFLTRTDNTTLISMIKLDKNNWSWKNEPWITWGIRQTINSHHHYSDKKCSLKTSFWEEKWLVDYWSFNLLHDTSNLIPQVKWLSYWYLVKTIFNLRIFKKHCSRAYRYSSTCPHDPTLATPVHLWTSLPSDCQLTWHN